MWADSSESGSEEGIACVVRVFDCHVFVVQKVSNSLLQVPVVIRFRQIIVLQICLNQFLKRDAIFLASTINPWGDRAFLLKTGRPRVGVRCQSGRCCLRWHLGDLESKLLDSWGRLSCMVRTSYALLQLHRVSLVRSQGVCIHSVVQSCLVVDVSFDTFAGLLILSNWVKIVWWSSRSRRDCVLCRLEIVYAVTFDLGFFRWNELLIVFATFLGSRLAQIFHYAANFQHLDISWLRAHDSVYVSAARFVKCASFLHIC